MSQARTPLLAAQLGHSDYSAISLTHKDWENPQVYQRNRLGSHAPLVSHTQQSQALSQFSEAARQSPTSNVILLSNTEWRFNLFEMPESVTRNFHDPSFDSSQWSKVSEALQALNSLDRLVVVLRSDRHRWTSDRAQCRSKYPATGSAKVLEHRSTPTSSTLFP